MLEVVVGPNDVVSIPVDSYLPGHDGSLLRSNHSGLRVIGGLIESEKKKIDFSFIKDNPFPIKLSQELMAIIYESCHVAWFSVLNNAKDKKSLGGVIRNEKLKDQTCYDAVFDDVEDRVLLICTEGQAGSLKYTLHIL